jgi:hypothetical protein
MNATEIDPKVLERYAKIARIAAQATGNERDAADAMRKRIEERYPGIVEALRTREIRDQTRDRHATSCATRCPALTICSTGTTTS